MTNKTLFIHAGGSKTGSSALQNFFEFNVANLESYNFAYENRLNIQSEYEINSGNGMLLYETLLLESSNESEIDYLVLSYFGKNKNAICSSEYFADLAVNHWKMLIDSAERLGIQLKVIFYVRNVIPYLLSAYDQFIKRHGEWRSFDEMTEVLDWQHGRALQVIADSLPSSAIHVFHFDLEKNRLIRGFLDILGIDNSFLIDSISQKKQINRSLSFEERELLRSINKIFGDTYSTELSDLLIYSKPNHKVEPAQYSKATANLISTRFNKQVDWVNRTFFNNLKVVSTLPTESNEKAVNKKSTHIPMNRNDLESKILDWSLNKLKTTREETSTKIFTSLKNATTYHAPNHSSNIPSDFNLLAYLVLNPDILLSGCDPIIHFITQGHKEKRSYKFQDNEIISSKASSTPQEFTLINDHTLPNQYQEIKILKERIDVLTRSLKQWQGHVKDISKENSDRERELYSRLIQSIKNNVNLEK